MIIEFGSQYVQHFLAHRYKKNDLTKTKVSTDAKKDSESGIISENPRRKCNHTIDYIIRLECLVLAPYNMMDEHHDPLLPAVIIQPNTLF